jgi:hypothetical protein
VDRLTQFVDVLELKMTATRDLLVCRTEALVVDDGGGGVASQLEDAYKALSEQVQTLMVAVGMEDARTGTFSAQSASSQSGVVGGGICDNGITVLTREVQAIVLLQERAQAELLACLDQVSGLEAAVLQQARIVEDECDLVNDVPSPRKRMRSEMEKEKEGKEKEEKEKEEKEKADKEKADKGNKSSSDDDLFSGGEKAGGGGGFDLDDDESSDDSGGFDLDEVEDGGDKKPSSGGGGGGFNLDDVVEEAPKTVNARQASGLARSNTRKETRAAGTTLDDVHGSGSDIGSSGDDSLFSGSSGDDDDDDHNADEEL